jgi:3-hydroxybutyryl-CoA dehydratase
MTATLPPGLYTFDQLQIGDSIATDQTTVTARAIVEFAALTGDNFEIHMTDHGAAKHCFPSQVAHGLLVLSLVEGLKSRAAARFSAFASLGWDWAFRKPVFAGDSIRCTVTVIAKRRSPNPAHGLLTLDIQVLNQRDEVVQKGQAKMMAYRSGAATS